jgi:hypothetical protein
MAQFLAPIINSQQEDANGAPLSGGTISVYFAGTSTPASTTSDQAGLVPNTWPITLNTLGVNSQGAVWIAGGFAYKFVIKNAAGVTQRTIDNVSGMNDFSTTLDQWVLFAGTPVYVSASSFTVPGDQTNTFSAGTRVKTANTGGTVLGTVVASSYVAPNTLVTIATDGGSLDAGLSAVSTGLLTAANSAIPTTYYQPPFRNRIINGTFRTDQRNNGSPQTIVAAAAAAYTVDRFYAVCTGANVSVARVVSGTGYALEITGAVGNTGTLIGTKIESQNCADWVNKQIYCQIAATSTAGLAITWTAYTADATDNFAAKTSIATGTFVADGTKKYFNFAAGANAGRGVCIEFSSGAVGAASFLTYIGSFQAEASLPTPFEIVPLADELARCKRYFQYVAVGFQGEVVNGSTYGGSVTLCPEMRAAPTLTFKADSLNTSFPAGFGLLSATGPFWVVYNKVANATAAGVYSSYFSCAAEL